MFGLYSPLASAGSYHCGKFSARCLGHAPNAFFEELGRVVCQRGLPEDECRCFKRVGICSQALEPRVCSGQCNKPIGRYVIKKTSPDCT